VCENPWNGLYKELCLHESWADEQGECSHKYVQVGR